MINIGLADKTAAIKATSYDVAHFGSFQEGRSVLIWDFLLKQGTLVLTKKTKTVRTGDTEVDEQHYAAAKQLANPADAPMKTIIDAKCTPILITNSKF